MPSNDERRVEILRYVIERQRAKQRTTKAEVIRHMRGSSAVNTTHGLIMDLINEGKLNVEKLNSQVHFLTINEDNEFNKIYNFLSELENFINSTEDQPLSSIKWLKLNPKDPEKFKNQLRTFQSVFQDIAFTIIDELIGEITMIKSEQDKQILYTKIIGLQIKLGIKYGGYGHYLKDQFYRLISQSKKWSESFAEDKSININLLNEFKDIMQKYERVVLDFSKEFLVKSGQKTKEPGEKSG